MPVFTFGRYRLDSAARRLARDQEPVPLPERHLDILLHLVSHAGEVLTKDALIARGVMKATRCDSTACTAHGREATKLN